MSSLLDLPSPLVYEITKLLDVRSQRSLFMTHSQLYAMWHVRSPVHDPEWRHFSWCLDQLEQASTVEGYDSLLCCAQAFFQSLKVQIFYSKVVQGFRLVAIFHPTLRECRKGSKTHSLAVTCKTQDDVFNKIITAEELDYGELVLVSKLNLELQQYQVMAKDMFDKLLLVTQGRMTLHLSKPLLNTSAQNNDFPKRDPGMLVVHDQYTFWTIDRERCFVSTPTLNFDKLPEDVTKVTANYLNHKNAAWSADAEHVQVHFDLNSIPKKDFAYNGNVYIYT